MTGHKDANRRARDVWRPRSGGDSRGLFDDGEEQGGRTADEITRSVWKRGSEDRDSVGAGLEDAGRGLFESAGVGRGVDFDRQRPSGRFAPEDTGPDPQRGVDRAPDGRYVSPDRTRPRLRRDDDGRFTSGWSL